MITISTVGNYVMATHLPVTSNAETATVTATTIDEPYAVVGVTDGIGDAAGVQSIYSKSSNINQES